MDRDEQFLNSYFSYISTLCFDKAKEHIDKEKEKSKSISNPQWNALIAVLPQMAYLEKNYMEIGFLQTKNKGFLRKDNSLKSAYDTMKSEVKKIQDSCNQSQSAEMANYCLNIGEFLSARTQLIEFYEFVLSYGSKKYIKCTDLLLHIQMINKKNLHLFTGIIMTPLKAVFNLECEILECLFMALSEMSRLHFIGALSLIYGTHTRLSIWERKMENRETWKLGFLKNTQLPLLFQWHMKFKATVLSKFSFFFYNTLLKQTTITEMNKNCMKLQYDYYSRMTAFQRKYDAVCVMLLADLRTESHAAVAAAPVQKPKTETTPFSIIVTAPSLPVKFSAKMDDIIRILTELHLDLSVPDKVCYKVSSTSDIFWTHIVTKVEPEIFMLIIFDSRKSEKDVYINNFLSEFCANLRCTKLFAGIKQQS